MSVEITGGCCNCGKLCSNGFEHPIPNNPLLACSRKCAEQYNIKVRKKKLNKILKSKKGTNIWKSIRNFLSLRP